MEQWKINYMASIPLNKQLECKIKVGLLKGELKQGDLLPSVKSLSQKLFLSASIISKVYRHLQKEGILCFDAASGYYISARTEPL